MLLYSNFCISWTLPAAANDVEEDQGNTCWSEIMKSAVLQMRRDDSIKSRRFQWKSYILSGQGFIYLPWILFILAALPSVNLLLSRLQSPFRLKIRPQNRKPWTISLLATWKLGNSPAVIVFLSFSCNPALVLYVCSVQHTYWPLCGRNTQKKYEITLYAGTLPPPPPKGHLLYCIFFSRQGSVN